MDKDEINIPQRGRPRKSREMGFQPSPPVQGDMAQADFEGMLDVGGEESVNDLLQREYRKYVDRNKLDINQNNLENYLKLKDQNRKLGVRGDKARFDFEKKDGEARREAFQSQGQILSHISSIFPDKGVTDDFEMPYARDEKGRRGGAQIEKKLGLVSRSVADCDEFLGGHFKDGESMGGVADGLAAQYPSDGSVVWATSDSGSPRRDENSDSVPLMQHAHGPAYCAGDRTSIRGLKFSDCGSQDDACSQSPGQGEAQSLRESAPDAERYGKHDADINKSSEFSPRFGTRHEGDFYGLEPLQSSHSGLYGGGQAETAADYAQRRFHTRDPKVASMAGGRGCGAYGRAHHEPMYQYNVHDYCDHVQSDGQGHAFAAGCNFVNSIDDQQGFNGFSMCRQGRYQDGMHGAEGFVGCKRGDRDGFLQQRGETGFAGQKGAGGLDAASQKVSWREGAAGYQGGAQYSMGIDGLRFQGGRHASDVIQEMHPGLDAQHFYRHQVEDVGGDKFPAGDQGIAQYINTKYSAGTSLGQTLSHSSNVSSFEPNPNNPLFQNYSMWVNRKKRKNNPLLWQYINQGHSFVYPSKYSNLDYVHKKMYLGTITQVPIEKNNHQILPLFLNSASNTPEFMKIGGIFLERTRGINYDNVTVMQLKNLMKEFGLCHNGKKTELIERVKATVEKIEQKMSKKKEAPGAEGLPHEAESREEAGNIGMDDVADDAAFMYF